MEDCPGGDDELGCENLKHMPERFVTPEEKRQQYKRYYGKDPPIG